MTELENICWAFAGLPLAGMVSAFVTIRIQVDLRHNPDLLGSGVFGVLFSAAFWLFLGLRSLWKTAAFIAASVAAAYLAVLSAVAATGKLFPAGPPYEPVNFVGGAVGALALVIAALLLLSPHPKPWPVLINGIFSSLAGGALGVIGYALGDVVGRVRPRLAFVPVQQTNSDISLILVWQTGMGLVLALALWTESRRLRAGRLPNKPVSG
jgi:hypothetical protein